MARRRPGGLTQSLSPHASNRVELLLRFSRTRDTACVRTEHTSRSADIYRVPSAAFALFVWQFSPAVVAGIIMPTKPTIIEMDMGKLEDALRRAEDETRRRGLRRSSERLCDAYATLAELIDDKNTSIARLRKLLFGAKTEKTAAVIASRSDLQAPAQEATASAASPGDKAGAVPPQSTTDAGKPVKQPPKGHGRNGADAYTGAAKVIVQHQSLQPGDCCPQLRTGHGGSDDESQSAGAAQGAGADSGHGV